MVKKVVYTSEYAKLSLKELAALIRDEHLSKMKEAFEVVITQLEVAAKVETEKSEIRKTLVFVRKAQAMFLEHAAKEVRLLFPMLGGNTTVKAALPDRLETEMFLDELKAEHDMILSELMKTRSATGEYHYEPSASPSHKLAYAQLNDLEQDLNRLVFVEEEYLYPRLLFLQKQKNPQS